ncbi:MAG: NigD-like protein [Candidatus Cryptobacteroides sp.]
MKSTIKRMAVAAIATLPLMTACNHHDNSGMELLYPNAMVTIKTTEDAASSYFQLDDETTLKVTNITKPLYGGKEVRAFVNFTEVDDDPAPYDKAVKMNWADSIRTKNAVPYPTLEEDDKYGNDPIEILKDWTTIVEDGYFTMRFQTYFGNPSIKHELNLLYGGNPDNPYEIELRHNAHGDWNDRLGDGYIAFRLKDLPDTKGETVKLTLKWNSFSGEKTHQFDYCTRKGDGE